MRALLLVRYKPGDPARAPPWVAPHQPRLDWQMWFAALGSPEVCRLLLSSTPQRGLLTGGLPMGYLTSAQNPHRSRHGMSASRKDCSTIPRPPLAAKSLVRAPGVAPPDRAGSRGAPAGRRVALAGGAAAAGARHALAHGLHARRVGPAAARAARHGAAGGERFVPTLVRLGT